MYDLIELSQIVIKGHAIVATPIIDASSQDPPAAYFRRRATKRRPKAKIWGLNLQPM
jgi:hypothetical protein